MICVEPVAFVLGAMTAVFVWGFIQAWWADVRKRRAEGKE